MTNWVFGSLDRLIAEGEGEPDDSPRTIVEYLRRREASRNPAI